MHVGYSIFLIKESTKTKKPDDMKFFVAFAALVALTAAAPVDSDLAQLEAIVAAINSPSTDPATAALLEEQLADIISALNPIAVGPAFIPPSLVPEKPESVIIGPALVPVKPDGPVAPSPVVIGDIPVGSSPLVQIIINVNKATPEDFSPVLRPEPIGEIPAEPVQVVEVAPEPVDVVEVAPEPVDVVEVAPEPVQVVEVAPVPIEPVQIGVPIIPEAAVILPEHLN